MPAVEIELRSTSSCVVQDSPSSEGHDKNHDGDDSRHQPLARLVRLKRRFERTGIVHSVEAVVLMHTHQHPHVMLLRRTERAGVLPPTSIGPPPGVSYRLPGGKVRAPETDVECLQRKIQRDLLATAVDMSSAIAVQEVLAVWSRPHFDRAMYPYTPAHVSEPKELRTLYLVQLTGPHVLLTAPDAQTELVAVPLFDLYENAAKYGAVIASIPHLVSRFQFLFAS